MLDPSQNVAGIIASSPPGTDFFFTPGTYRTQITPKDGQTFTGDATLTGATLLTGWTKTGTTWTVTGITAEGSRKGKCNQQSPFCTYPEDLYLDDVLQRQIGSTPGPGEFTLNYQTNVLQTGTDPTGKRAELTTLRNAFNGTASDVTIEGLTIEKYANPAQTGAIEAKAGNNLAAGWVVRWTTVRWNHGVGVKMGTGMLVEGNDIYQNGQLGIGTGPAGRNNRIRVNTVTGNSTVGYASGFEAGGMKLTANQDILVEGNTVENNVGPGIWFDVNVRGATVLDNTVTDNTGPGIFYEISYQAVIASNIVSGNGFGWTQWLYGAGILIAHSPDVLVEDNIVDGNRLGIIGIQQGRGGGQFGPHEIRNLVVRGNCVRGEGSSGVGQSIGSNAMFSSWGIVFANNRYDVAGEHWRWLGKTWTLPEFQAMGQGLGSTNGGC